MLAALSQRLISGVVILLGVTLLTFVIAFVIPADPARLVAGPKADEATVRAIRTSLGLDRPVIVQYGHYLSRLVRGDLGRSYLTGQRVVDAIGERFPATAYLAFVSLGMALVLGIGLGTLTALRQGSSVDLAVLTGSVVALSLPVFWLGMILLYVFAFRLRWLPLGGFGGPHVILPACALGLGIAAYYARLLHTNLRAVMAEDYVRTARAKGLSPWLVYGKHALRNALLPLVTLVGLDFAGLMSGVVLTETVFNWPGLGRLAVEAVFNQDIPMIMGTVLFSGTLVVGANIVVDFIYLAIDPRIRRPGE